MAVNPVTNKIYVANNEQRQRDGDRRRDQRTPTGAAVAGTLMPWR